MGWWTSKRTNSVIGDEPLDALGDAVALVVALYSGRFGRKPTRAEWETLLETTLGHDEPEFRCMDEGVVAKVALTLE